MKVNSNIYYNIELDEHERFIVADCLKFLEDLLDTLDRYECYEIINCDDVTLSRNEVEDTFNELYNIGMIEKMHKE